MNAGDKKPHVADRPAARGKGGCELPYEETELPSSTAAVCTPNHCAFLQHSIVRKQTNASVLGALPCAQVTVRDLLVFPAVPQSLCEFSWASQYCEVLDPQVGSSVH